MTEHQSICAICNTSFLATTAYGLCPSCWQRDRLREFDRLESAKRHARRAKVPVTLTLVEWLGILSDFNAKCAYCLTQYVNSIDMVLPEGGLVRGNVAPICKSCSIHKRETFDAAMERVQAYLDGVLPALVSEAEYEEC